MKSVPPEFAEFVREVGIRAFDRLAVRLKERAASSRTVLRSWSKLTPDDKAMLMDDLIASAQSNEEMALQPDPAAPRITRRFEPAEVEPTLPAKPKPRKKSTKKK